MSGSMIDDAKVQVGTTAPVSAAAPQLKMLPASSRAEAMFLWRSLELELGNRRLMCSSVWTDTWLDHFGSLVPHQFAVRMVNGCAEGIALLTQGVDRHAGPFALNTWHVGTAGEADADSLCVEYNTLLCRFEDRICFAHELLMWVADRSNADEFHLDGFESACVRKLQVQSPEITLDSKPSHFFDLATTYATGEDPIMQLTPRTRGKIRRTLRYLGDVRCEWAATAQRAEQIFRELVELHQARWKSVGKPGSYSSRRFFDFHLDLLHRAVPLGMMGFFRVHVNNQTIGCTQILIDDNRALVYQSGRIAVAGPISLGVAIDYLCIRECLQRRYDAIDFLAGNAVHKQRLSTNSSDLAWLTWRRPNLKNATVDAMRRLKSATIQLGRSISSAVPLSRWGSGNPAREDER